MKRFLSIFLVLVVLSLLSVSVFASDIYTPKTVSLTADIDNGTFLVPSSTKIYIGDTVIIAPTDCNLCSYFNAPSSVVMIFPSHIDIYNNGVKVDELTNNSTNTFSYTFDNFSAGVVEFIATDYIIGGPSSGFDVSESLTYLSFELKDPSVSEVVHPVESIPSVFESLMTMITELVRTVVYYPLLLTFAVLCLVGLGIGLFIRYKK